MSKKSREVTFQKCNGRCAYCGDPLKKGWHEDHAEPVERKYERTKEYYKNYKTGEKISEIEYWTAKRTDRSDFKRIRSRLIVVGFNKPENDTPENKLPACASCNINKHGMNIEQFRSFIERFVASLNRDSTQYKIAKRYGLIKETGKKVKFYFETMNDGKKKVPLQD